MKASIQRENLGSDVGVCEVLTRALILASAMLVVLCAPVSIAQEQDIDAAAVLDTTRNAAQNYRALWHNIDDYLDIVSTKTDETFNLGSLGWRPNEEMANLLGGMEGTIEQFIVISRIPTADFGIDCEHGFGTLLPHIRKIRITSIVLMADARRLMAEGRADEAATRIAAVYRIPAQFHAETTPVSALVRASIERSASREAANLAADPSLTDTGRNELIKTIDALREHDRLGFLLTLHAYPRLIQEWANRTYQGPLATKQFCDDMFIDDSLSRSIAMTLSGKQVSELFARHTELHDKALRSWDDINALRDLDRRASITGEFGIVAKEFGFSLARLRHAEVSADEALRNARKALVGEP